MTIRTHLLRRAAPLLALIATLLLPPALCSPARAANEADVAILDSILTSVPPDQTTVQIDDMVFTVKALGIFRDQLANGSGKAATPNPINSWTSGVVVYEFDANVTAENRRHFLDAAAEWTTYANLTFTERTAETDYMDVFDNGAGGNFSAIGMIGGRQDFAISSDGWTRNVLLHEIGHALGFVHEHQRPDRDSFVTILTANIVSGAEPNFVKLPAGNVTTFGAYDFLSIMHYSKNTFSTDPNTLNTIEPLPAYAGFLNIMGQLNDPPLSALDRSVIATVYGAGPVLGGVIVNTQDSGPGSLRQCLYYGFDNPGSTLTFNIPGTDPNFSGGVYTIRPTGNLPSVPASTTLQGGSQPGDTNPNGPEIQLSGDFVQQPAFFLNGLRMLNANATVEEIIINNFSSNGILIAGTGATGNQVTGCYIGVNAAGTAAVPNDFQGVQIENGASNNTVGGETGPPNVISGNSVGIIIDGTGCTGNVVCNSRLGTNAAGTAAIANTFFGVEIRGGASSNRIGGTTANAGNLVSGNGSVGIFIRNSGTDSNTVEGNFAGLDVTGTAAIPNTFAGIEVSDGARFNTIGGTAPNAGNVSSGNGGGGVLIRNTGTDSNVVQGNILGANAAGTAAVPNAFAGAEIGDGAQSNTIGGSVAGAGNLISGNTNQGVVVRDTNTDSNTVAGNWIGVDITGATELANGFAGVSVSSGASSNLVGGTSPGARNVISGNGNQGVLVWNSGTSGNTISGNYIGLNAAGTAAIGNAFSGIRVTDSTTNNVIGGTSLGAGNLVSGNLGSGVAIDGGGTTGNRVEGNTVGLDTTGADTGNTFSGVALFGGAQNNVVGGTVAGAANRISGNIQWGVSISDPPSMGNSVLSNSIFDNDLLGIDLLPFFGVNANDPDDADFLGPNGLQNFPALSTALLEAGGTNITGSLDSTPSTTFRIEFFANPSTDISGNGEGKHFIGAIPALATNGSGDATINTVLPVFVPAGYTVTATATDSGNNTSEFSNNVTVTTTDTDSDGMPDAYESANGLTVGINDADLDLDGDGSSNFAEMKLGTDPQLANSRIQTAIDLTGGMIEVSLPTIDGKIYDLHFSSDLGATDPWEVIYRHIPGTGAVFMLSDPNLLSAGFYRFTPAGW